MVLKTFPVNYASMIIDKHLFVDPEWHKSRKRSTHGTIHPDGLFPFRYVNELDFNLLGAKSVTSFLKRSTIFGNIAVPSDYYR